MAAGEDQAQPVIFECFVGGAVVVGRGDGGDELRVLIHRCEACMAADAVDGLEAAGGHQPGTRVGGQTFARPLLKRRAKGFLHRFFGKIEIAQQADQRGEHAARFLPEDGVHRGCSGARRILHLLPYS